MGIRLVVHAVRRLILPFAKTGKAEKFLERSKHVVSEVMVALKKGKAERCRASYDPVTYKEVPAGAFTTVYGKHVKTGMSSRRVLGWTRGDKPANRSLRLAYLNSGYH